MEEEAASSSNQTEETKPEVSLPGSDVNSIEQPAILQVLSPLNATEEKVNKIEENPVQPDILFKQPSSSTEEPQQSHNDDVKQDYLKPSNINLVSSSNKSQSHIVITTPTPTPTPSPTKDCKFDPQTGEILFPDPSQNNILDIESHLIETYNELFPHEESVGINELPPIEDELQVGCSKVETDDNVRTVIEVQPAEVITKKPIEKLIETDSPLQAAQVTVPTLFTNGETCVNKDEIESVAEKLIQDIEEEVQQLLATSKTERLNKNSEEEEVKEAKETKEAKEVKEAEQGKEAKKAKESKEAKEAKEVKKEKEAEIVKEANIAKEVKETKEEKVEIPSILSKENVTEFNEKTEDLDKTDTCKNDVKLPKLEDKFESIETAAEEKLSEVVDQQLSEVNSILDSQVKKSEETIKEQERSNLKLISVPSIKTASEEEERKLFIESLPPLEANVATQSDAEKLALDCKREYYQSLKKYLVQSSTDKPPVPLQTYRWEDLRRAKERGGYPWTHLYKRPLGPDEEPEILLMLRKSQEIRFTSESPKSNKKVRIDDHVSIQETERYIQELSEEDDEPNSEHLPHRQTHDLENHSLHSESFSFASDSVLTTGKQPKKSGRFSKVRRLFRRRRYGARQHDDAQSLPDSFTNTSLQHSLEQVPQPGSANQLEATKQQEQQKELGTREKEAKNGDEPIYVHSKSPRCFPIMKKLKSMADRQKKRLNIKRIHLGKDDKIVLNEEPKILKLKNSPKSQRSDIPHFIEKQDSDDVLEIVQLDESPSRKRRDDEDDGYVREEDRTAQNSSIVKPEEIIEIKDIQTKQADNKDDNEESNKKADEVDAAAIPPKKAPRLRREHVYEEIDHPDEAVAAAEELKFILDATSVDAIKQSLVSQDTNAIKEVATTNNNIPLDRMGSSEEEPITLTDRATPERKSNSLLAPISSIDSASSDEDRTKLHLQPVVEEETDHEEPHEEEETSSPVSQQQINLAVSGQEATEHKTSLKKEASPAPSEKKVTFSHVEDEAEPHREDIELAAEQLEAAKEANKWKNTLNDHEYEPIGTPSTEEKSSEIMEVSPNQTQTTTTEVDTLKQAEDMQKELEDRFFTSTSADKVQKTPQMEIDVEAVDSADVAMDVDEPPKTEKKGFMATAQDRTRRMQAGFKNQAGKLKTKLKPAPKKIPSGSPKAKERKKFKAPEFSKLKMPEMKRPDMTKFKEFKRPEFTKFSKPDMSKFKLPEKMTNIKLRRSKSLKETEPVQGDEELGSEVTETVQKTKEAPTVQKKRFEFNFGTYPRALRKKKTVEVESSFDTGTATEATSVIPSTETQPSLESSSSPQGDRGPGPVRSRWADKFSDVSYNDSEGSRYRRYGSEQESFDRESSLERRMREDLEDTASEERNLGILSVTDTTQFAEFDEENRVIHEISNLRSGEFKRRPITHQDSDVRSEDSKEVIGWTEKDIQKNTLLRKAELEAESSYHKYQPDDVRTQETQSTASSGKKVVLEEIGDDEFFLRKRGISQDNIEINQYIRSAFRDDYDKPINALEHVGQPGSGYADYDVPPPKPRRLHKAYAPDSISQEFDGQRSDYGDDFSMSQNGSDYFGAPRRPMRKGRSRSKYSVDSQEVDSRKYMDEEYLREPSPLTREEQREWNDLNMSEKENIPHEPQAQPLPPRRQKRRRDISMEKDSYMNGFGGRSVSSSFLQPTEDVIVYRTEHEYHHIPLATPEKYSDNGSTRKSVSNYDLDERHSRGAISFEQNEDVRGGEPEKFVIDMMENDGYAVVRKEQIPKPTPPVRRKKFTRAPGERFATMPNMRSKRSTPPPERPPPPRGYTPVSDVVMVTGRKSALSLDAQPNYEDDYEEPGVIERNLQSGDVINKMKYRPLPPPPRPPREKRQRSISKGSEGQQRDYRSFESEDILNGKYDQEGEDSDMHVEEVEACTQTDPLPDDFVCEEFEITDDMKIIEPRIRPSKTVEEMLKEELEKELNISHQVIDSEQLAKGLQRFRDANQRSLSERSRASSQADRSKSHSRPQTPSAILVERQSSTPVQKDNTEVVAASLIVRPIDDLELEEEELRREGLLTDSSQHSVSDTKEDYRNLAVSEASYAPSSTELDEALGVLTSDPETQQTDEEVERTLQRYRDELDAIGRELMETQTTSQEPSPSVSREEIKVSDRELEPSDREDEQRSDLDELLSDIEFKEESLLSEIKEEEPEELTPTEMEISEVEAPQPPPRRKSTTAIEQSPPPAPPTPVEEDPYTQIKQIPMKTVTAVKAEELPLVTKEQKSMSFTSTQVEEQDSKKELAPMQTIVKSEPEYQLPARLGDLEVERLRVHALQAGQIMVSQLHGQQISSDELECKSGNLVVQNIELPPGLIENIVEQVRQKERSQHLTTETQTSLPGSSEHLSSTPVREIVPPPKPPRLRDLEAAATTITKKPSVTAPIPPNTDEQTQTDQTEPEIPSTTTPPPTVFPTAEYLQTLAPLAFYNLHRAAAAAAEDPNLDIRPPQRHRHRHRRSSSSEAEDKAISESEEGRHHRRRTRSTRTPSSDDDQKSVTKAGRKFLTACSLSLCSIINQLTDFVRGKEPKEGVELEPTDIRNRHVPALVVLFIVVTFVVLLYLMTGRTVHTHHWDYFNPPGQEGR